ncbi:MAG: type II secretion system protein, partial [Lachnospiraceae bacterium]|nr:type II secretion system protein [Lachnospiraceae bacterium]
MKKNNRGFTLVELICVIAILGLITVAIFSFLLSGMGMAKETKKSAALSENSRTAISKMKTDIMNCG